MVPSLSVSRSRPSSGIRESCQCSCDAYVTTYEKSTPICPACSACNRERGPRRGQRARSYRHQRRCASGWELPDNVLPILHNATNLRGSVQSHEWINEYSWWQGRAGQCDARLHHWCSSRSGPRYGSLWRLRQHRGDQYSLDRPVIIQGECGLKAPLLRTDLIITVARSGAPATVCIKSPMRIMDNPVVRALWMA